jgi:predicted dehydrogenase
MSVLDRREFLQKTTSSAGVILGAPMIKSGMSKDKPSETIRVAVVGIRSRGAVYSGGGHLLNLAKIPNVKVSKICDIDERLFADTIKEFEKTAGYRPQTETDFRRLLDDKEIDAVSLATPDHWHALHTIWACQAGKDVYVEKPISYTIEEGRKMVEAARKYNRIVQVGTQSRSSKVVHEAVRLIQDGVIGKPYMGRGIVYRFRESIGRVKDSPIPDGVNWDVFLGPAPYRPFNENRFHYNWHWVWDTSTTEFGNNGTHAMDRIRWAMNKRVHPKIIHCMGGLYHRNDTDQEVPNVQVATFEYDDGTFFELEVRCLDSNPEANVRGGSFVYGTEGWMFIDHLEFKTYLGRNNDPGPTMTGKDLQPVVERLEPIHFGNWIDCIRSRKWQNLNADIAEGHLSTSMMHLGNISYRTGRKLHFNSAAEKFVDDEDADSYLTRQYRPPFVLPEKV